SATYRVTNSSGQVVESAEMDTVGANAGLFNVNPFPTRKSSGELQSYFSPGDMNSTTECNLVVDSTSLGGIPMPCVLVESMSRGGAVRSATSLGFSTGVRHAVWVIKDTSYGPPSDLDRQFVTIYSGPGGEFVWVDEPGSVIETWVQMKKVVERRMSATEISNLLNDILDLFKNHPGCEEKINAILGELASSSGFNAGTIRQIIERFRTNGIIFTTDVPNEGSE